MKLDITVSSTLQIDVSQLKECSQIAFGLIKHRFTYKNPKFIENAKWGYSNYNTPKHLFSYRINDGIMYISRGGLDWVKHELAKFKIAINIVDRTLVCEPVSFEQSKVVRRADQKKFISEMKAHTQGCGVAYTAFGKTLSMLELGREIRQPILILVHTTFIQEQWIEEAINPKLFNLDPRHIGGVGGLFGSSKAFKNLLGQKVQYKKRKLCKLNVCIYNSLMNSEHLEFFRNNIGLVLFDEGQKSPIEGIQQVVNNFRARYRYAVSAELKRKDGKEFLTFDTFGPVRSRIKETNSETKIICNINLITTKYGDLNYDDPESETYKNFSAMLTRMARDKVRNILICKRAIRKVKQGDLVIIFVARKEHAGILAKMLSKFKVALLTGAMNKHDIAEIKSPSVRKILSDYDHKTAYKKITTLAKFKELDIVIGTQKSEIGLNIRAFNHGIITHPVSGERFKQIKGRIERTYSKEQVKFFGCEKSIPTLDVLVDKDLDPSTNAAEEIKEVYKKRVRKIKLRKTTITR